MILRKLVKKTLGLCENTEVEALKHHICEMRKSNYALQRKLRLVEGQANVDVAEHTYFKEKLRKIREVLGEDDRCFSRFTRDQISDMSREEFNSVEAEIDQDVLDGKLFLS